jgi:hypothetical protein
MKTVTNLLAILLFTVWAGVAQAAMFNISYDNSLNGDNSIIGTGTFAYDGPTTAGSFLLSDLSGVSFSAVFNGDIGGVVFDGPPFDPVDTSLIGIEVTGIGGGIFELVFSGDSAGTGGSLDIGSLSHVPNTIGGGATGPQPYFATAAGLDAYGNYVATSVVPLPAAAWLFISAIGGLVAQKRLSRRSAG